MAGNQRIKQLRARMRALGLDAVVTMDTANLRWLTGWTEIFDSEQAHLALITQTKACLHTDSRYSDGMLAKDKEGVWQIKLEPMGSFTGVAATLAKSKKPTQRLGFEPTIQLDLFKALKKALAAGSGSRSGSGSGSGSGAGSGAGASGIKLVEIRDLFGELRAVKDEEEIRILKKAQKITDAAFTELLTWIKPGMSELEIANRLEFSLRDQGAEGVSFASIVASGPHAAVPHARPTKRRIKSGDFLTLDFGAQYLDYAADMTRTLVIGKASDRQRQIYETVLLAQTTAKQGIKAGITGKQAHDLAVDVFEQVGMAAYFTHTLGHGVGIDIHEMPRLGPKNTQPLLAGNVVTVEPGLYLPGFGGVRIEDFGLVTATGFTNFTKSNHQLIEII